MSVSPFISVVSPVYRAEKLVRPLVERITAAVTTITPHYEIVLVDDAEMLRAAKVLWFEMGLAADLSGAAAIAAAWFYTGGKKPYGYAGLGEIMVFIFFGLVPTVGTAFLLVQAVWIDSILSGVAMGLFAMAVLHINNLRDRSTDVSAGKRTLATRMPVWLGRLVYSILILAPFGILVYFTLILISAGWTFL